MSTSSLIVPAYLCRISVDKEPVSTERKILSSSRRKLTPTIMHPWMVPNMKTTLIRLVQEQSSVSLGNQQA